jgi:hypothetical protein
MILSEHLVRSDTDGRDFNTHWYKWTIGRLQQVFLVVCSSELDILFAFIISYLNVIYFILGEPENR